jgi:hypothetical protein
MFIKDDMSQRQTAFVAETLAMTFRGSLIVAGMDVRDANRIVRTAVKNAMKHSQETSEVVQLRVVG